MNDLRSPAERRAEISARARDGLTPADLHEIANGGLMDANRVYLPAGTLSEAEYREREARIRRGEAA